MVHEHIPPYLLFFIFEPWLVLCTMTRLLCSNCTHWLCPNWYYVMLQERLPSAFVKSFKLLQESCASCFHMKRNGEARNVEICTSLRYITQEIIYIIKFSDKCHYFKDKTSKTKRLHAYFYKQHL